MDWASEQQFTAGSDYIGDFIIIFIVPGIHVSLCAYKGKRCIPSH